MVLLLVSLAGAVLFAWPLLGWPAPPDLPALGALCAAILCLTGLEVGARRLDSRGIALLAVIAAVDAGLRLAVVNGIAGFSPVFFLILCAGYTFGATYGFLAGATTLLVSALVTGGVGVWLPYEMLGAGWCGVAAGIAGAPRRGRAPRWIDILILACVGVATGMAYGLVLDIWDWSLLRDAPDIGWTPGLGLVAEAGHFFHFYLTTSVAWDVFRAGGNAIAIVLLGRPILAAFVRLHRRFTVVIETGPETDAGSLAA